MVVEQNKLFVGNLDSRVKWFHLKEFFAQYGEVTYTKVVADRETKRSRGFGFVVFATDQDAASALEKANGVAIDLPDGSFPDRPLRLMYAEAPTDKSEGERRNEQGVDHEKNENEEHESQEAINE